MTNRRLLATVALCFLLGTSAGAVRGLLVARTQAPPEVPVPLQPRSSPLPLIYQPAVSGEGRVLAYLPMTDEDLIPISLERASTKARYWVAIDAAMGNNPSVFWPSRCPSVPVRKVWANGDLLNVTLNTPNLTVLRDHPSLLLALKATVADFSEVTTLTVFSHPRQPSQTESMTIQPERPSGYNWSLIGGQAWITANYSPGNQLSRIALEILGAGVTIDDAGPDGLSCEILSTGKTDDPGRMCLTADIVALTAQAKGVPARVIGGGADVAVPPGHLHPNPIAAASPSPGTRVAFLGDVSLGRRLTTLMTEHGTGYPFEDVSDCLASFDLVIANLESPVSDRGTPLPGKGIWLRARPEHSVALHHGQIDVVNIANNHMLDYDAEGLEDTLQTLNQMGIIPVGAGPDLDRARAGALFEVNGLRIGILGYTRYADIFWSYSYPRTFAATADLSGVAPLDGELILSDLEHIAPDCDIVIISLHWGEEDTHYPTPDQRELAEKLTQAGAHLIMGHHPHVMQGIERFPGGVVLYSLGNFVYDQYRQPNASSFIAGVQLDPGGVGAVEVQPVFLVQARPTLPPPEVAQRVLSDLAAYSRPLGTIMDTSGSKATIRTSP